MPWIDRQAVIHGGQAWARLVSRAWADPEFHRRLISRPWAAVEEILGSALAEELEIHVVQDEPGILTLVIPSGSPGADSRPLTNDQTKT